MRRRARTALELYRAGGPGSVAGRIVRLLGYRRAILFELALDRLPPPVEPELAVSFSFLSPDDVDAYERYRPLAGRARAQERLARGDRCFAAWVGGEIVGARWISHGDVTLDDLRIRLPLPPGAVFAYDLWVTPAYRRHHVSAAGMARLSRLLAAEGCLRMLATVLPENAIALRNVQRLRYVEVDRLATLAPGPLPALRVPYVGRRRR